MEVFVYVYLCMYVYMCASIHICIYIYISFSPRKQIKLLRAGKRHLIVSETMKVSSSQSVVSFQYSKKNY